MLDLARTNSENPDFQKLVHDLDTELSIRDGADHGFYSQYNKIDMIKYAIVAYEDQIPVGCGAIKEFDPDTMEVKRMFVLQQNRGRGVAQKVLSELESWAREMNYERCILETGKRQPEAIELYKKAGYKIIPNYGQYRNVDNSVCFEKQLT